MHPTNAAYVGAFFDNFTQVAMKTIIRARGEIYFQQMSQNAFGLLPVIYSMSLAKLQREKQKLNSMLSETTIVSTIIILKCNAKVKFKAFPALGYDKSDS